MSILHAGRRNWNRMMAATIIGCTGLATYAQPGDLLLPIWQPLFSIAPGFGYKDNVTLSHNNPESSAFFSSALEAFLVRLPQNGTEYTFFVSADDRRYFSAESVDKEQVAFAQAQFKHVFADAGEAALSAEYAYQDRIENVSTTETNFQAIRAQGHSLLGRCEFRFNFEANYWAMLNLMPARDWFEAPLDDYTGFAGAIGFGRDYGHGSTVSLQYEPSYRDYDSDPALDANGDPLAGSRRSSTQQEARFIWRHYWDAARRWRNTTRLGYRHNDENGGGYFNYARFSVAEQVRYQTAGWHCSAEAKLSFYDFQVQTVAPGSAEKRERTDLLLTVRTERQLTKALRLIGAYEYERTYSNVDLETYSANTVTASLQWEF
jgi:hypothetical protein